ncbi:MAG: hypothetical protein U1F06_05185 [Steroidobacteraceae bacterium]
MSTTTTASIVRDLLGHRGEDRALPEAATPSPLDAERLQRAKRAYTTRRVELGHARQLVGGRAPRPGDLALARVTRLGQHRALQSVHGRRVALFVGDEIVVAYGHRYAPDQFEALVPDELGACQLVAGGGVIARVEAAHDRMARATEVEPLGLLADAGGRVLNLAQFALRALPAAPRRRATVIAAVGTSMNSGKTTSAAHLMRGFALAGLRVGAAKVTGTGASGDALLFADAGAERVLEFLDFGHASTYRASAAQVDAIVEQTVRQLDAAGMDVIVIEIADGLLQPETMAMLTRPACLRLIDGLLFAAADSMGALAGIEWLENRGLPVVALTGLVTAAPLGVREAREAIRLPVMGLAALSHPTQAQALLAAVHARCAAIREPGEAHA